MEQVVMRSKIMGFDFLDEEFIEVRRGKRVVHCHGVFDLLHIGHIRHFKRAKSSGDILIVSVTPDCYVNKGPGRPVFNQELRAEAVASLGVVDYVLINKWPTAENTIHRIKPDIYVKGVEYEDESNDITAKIVNERTAVQSVGGDILYTEDITYSSSSLLNKYFPVFSDDVLSYLELFKRNHTVEQVLQYLDGAKNLSVLVVGEAIIDEYNFCTAIGKAGKEPVLVSKLDSKETYIGGALALANHVSSFCKKVTCLSYLGDRDNFKKLIDDKLNQNVTLSYEVKQSSPTILKRRYIEASTKQKLFETYDINDEEIDESLEESFLTRLQEEVNRFDVVIVADYGHGLISKRCVSYLTKHAKFLAVNAQANAGNHGFNCISKYPKADYVAIANRELQLTFRERHCAPVEHINCLYKDYDYKNIMVTDGKNGSFTSRKDGDIYAAPAFAGTVVDRVGAGDSVLAITSLCMAQGASSEVVGFIGNVVGAEAVNIMGNKNFIEKVSLKKHISHLMK